MERDVLHHSPELSVALVIDEGDIAHLELTTSPQGADLTQLEDVIVIVDGQGVTVTPTDRGHARAATDGHARILCGMGQSGDQIGAMG